MSSPLRQWNMWMDPVLSSFDQPASTHARTARRRGAELWKWVHWCCCRRTEVKDQQGQRTKRRGEGTGAGDRMQNEDWRAWNTFFYFRGSADVKEIRIQSLSLIRRDNIVILNPEPRFIHICGCQKEPFVLFLTHFCFHRWLQMHSWHPCHLKPHEVANAYSDGFILKMGLCSLLHLTLGYNSN